MSVELDPDFIRIDGGTQPRTEISQEVVDDYLQRMREGDCFPPVIVFFDGIDHWLADGFHRYHAAKQDIGRFVSAEVRKGTRRDAVLYSVGANVTHGLRRTNTDKRKAVETLLKDEEWSTWSDREIARRCYVDHKTVGSIRAELSLGKFPSEDNNSYAAQIKNYTTKHGTVATMNISNIGNAVPIWGRSSLSDQEGGLLRKQPAIPLLPFQETARQELASERALAYTEEIKQRVEDAWFKKRGLDKEQPEAQEALRVFIEQNTEEDEDEEWKPRYDGEHAAYCKYCYKTHEKWQLDEDAWLCEYCNHRTADQFMQIEDVEPSEAQKDFYRRHSVPTALLSSESNEWFTPSQYVEKARELMSGIDLDPASNAYANEKVVQAKLYYDIQANGLDKPWNGRVWLNPPYGRDEGGSNQEAWSRRLIEQYEAGITTEAVLLVNANTEAKWFQPLYNYLICFTNHRIRFYNTEGTPSQPTQGNAFIYFGHQKGRFTELFSAFGVVIRRIDNGS